MTDKRYGWALVALLLIFGVAAIIAYNRNHERALSISTNELANYTNDTYGYTFFYPPSYTVRVASEEQALIGMGSTSGFVTYAEARIATTSNAPSYAEFVVQQAQALCSVVPGQTCPDVAESSAYTTETNLAGQQYYLDLIQPDGTKQRFGPVYAFNIGGNVTNAQYATLLIYRPPSAQGAVEALSAGDIVKTLQINKIGS
jgi:hypothetical protein